MSYTKILVPTDFSTTSRVALAHAEALAARFGGRIDLLHVWETPPMLPEMMLAVAGGPPMAVRDYVREQAARDMETLVAELRQRGVIAHGRLEQGHAGKKIVELAEKDGYDLIVIATHGRRGVDRLLIGSVAEAVIRRATCPVLTVHPGDRAV